MIVDVFQRKDLNLPKSFVSHILHDLISHFIIAHIHQPLRKRRNTRTYSDLKQNSEYPGKVYRSFSYDLIYRITDQFLNVERKGDADCCQQNRKNNKNTILPKMPEYFF